MASTVTPSEFKVFIKEDHVVNGIRTVNENLYRIPNVTNYDRRIVTVPVNTNVDLINTNGPVPGPALFPSYSIAYGRITNMDDTNALELGMIGATTNYQVTLKAGESHILGSPDDLLLAEADTDPSFGSMEELVTIEVDPAGNAIDIEIFVASG